MNPLLLLALAVSPSLALSPPELGRAAHASVGLAGPRLQLHLAAGASAETYDVVKTKDGKVRVGRILQETEKGYLFRSADGESLVIEFTQIDDIQRTGAPAPSAAGTGHPGQPVAPPAVASPPPGYPAYPYDPMRVEREMRRVRLEASLRDMEARYAQLSYSGAVVTTVVGVVLVVLAVTFLDALDGDPNGAVLLVIGGIETIVGGVQVGMTAYDRSVVSEQMDNVRGELQQLGAQSSLRRTRGLVLARW